MTLIDYVKKNGDLTFFEEKFNEVDAAVLSAIAYVDLTLVFKDGNIVLPLGSALELFLAKTDLKKFIKNGFVQKDVIKLVRIIKDKIRYRNISLSNYVYDVTFDKQFSALTFKLPTGEKVIAFEGTDNNLVGWEEDFAMIYKFPVPADKDAISYINENVSLFDKSVIVVGHSKGGHLAMTAAAFSHWYVKLKIKSVYNLDGPGFRYNEINSRGFNIIKKKLHYIVPNYSLFGLLLRHPDNIRSIKSIRKDILAHSVFTWVINDSSFVDEPLSRISKNLDKSIVMWLEQHDDVEREKLVKDIFECFRKAGVNSLSDVTRIKVFLSLLKNLDGLDNSTKKLLNDFVKYNVEFHIANKNDDIVIS